MSATPRQPCPFCNGHPQLVDGDPIWCCAERANAHEAAQHRYVSTACHHGHHNLCRHTCKYCPAPCRCTCHKDPT